MEVMVCSAIKSRGIHDGTVISSGKVVYYVLDTLERWCRRVRIVANKTVDILHKIRAIILKDVEYFPYM